MKRQNPTASSKYRPIEAVKCTWWQTTLHIPKWWMEDIVPICGNNLPTLILRNYHCVEVLHISSFYSHHNYFYFFCQESLVSYLWNFSPMLYNVEWSKASLTGRWFNPVFLFDHILKVLHELCSWHSCNGRSWPCVPLLGNLVTMPSILILTRCCKHCEQLTVKLPYKGVLPI